MSAAFEAVAAWAYPAPLRSAFDTSGVIYAYPRGSDHDEPYPYRWEELPSDFVRDYIKAMWQTSAPAAVPGGWGMMKLWGFHMLAPETLMTILADCEAYQKSFSFLSWVTLKNSGRRMGDAFWQDRLDRKHAALWPRLTLVLCDDNKMRFR